MERDRREETRLKETYLNSDITEVWNGRTSERGGGTVEVKKKKRRRRGNEREMMMTMSGGCDALSSVQ